MNSEQRRNWKRAIGLARAELRGRAQKATEQATELLAGVDEVEKWVDVMRPGCLRFMVAREDIEPGQGTIDPDHSVFSMAGARAMVRISRIVGEPIQHFGPMPEV